MGEDKAARRVVLSSADIGRTLARMAHEITEKNPDVSSLALVGIITRGAPLARRMAEKICAITGVEIPVGGLDVTFYRDDLARKGPNLNASPTDIPFDISGKTVILVDDVLFTGRTIRSAIDAIMDLGRPGRIQLAALLDRGHRELPIRADYIGKNIPTSRDELVKVRVREIDGEDAAVILGGANG
ncbi:MAG: bifunctional pyr operon transcriptional regulator/uracil phosphoribosyltransferase PyrR [Nitrospinae bacterium]|nr:bifunctional pyr operon transcriptional regulator/uracil phosphoribosyltransferase PyrR [Nitrospinota bacterium]